MEHVNVLKHDLSVGFSAHPARSLQRVPDCKHHALVRLLQAHVSVLCIDTRGK